MLRVAENHGSVARNARENKEVWTMAEISTMTGRKRANDAEVATGATHVDRKFDPSWDNNEDILRAEKVLGRPCINQCRI